MWETVLNCCSRWDVTAVQRLRSAVAGWAFHAWAFSDVTLDIPHNTINMIPQLQNPHRITSDINSGGTTGRNSTERIFAAKTVTLRWDLMEQISPFILRPSKQRLQARVSWHICFLFLGEKRLLPQSEGDKHAWLQAKFLRSKKPQPWHAWAVRTDCLNEMVATQTNKLFTAEWSSAW